MLVLNNSAYAINDPLRVQDKTNNYPGGNFASRDIFGL